MSNMLLLEKSKDVHTQICAGLDHPWEDEK